MVINRLRIPALVAFCLFVAAGTGFAQGSWETFENKDFNIRFQVPGKWKTHTDTNKAGVPFLEAESPDGSLYLFVYAYKDASLSTDDLLDKAIADLGMKLKGDAQDEDINELQALVAEATGSIDGRPVGMFIMAATFEDDNYVAYVFTELAKFDKNTGVMNQILDSFAPIK